MCTILVQCSYAMLWRFKEFAIFLIFKNFLKSQKIIGMDCKLWLARFRIIMNFSAFLCVFLIFFLHWFLPSDGGIWQMESINPIIKHFWSPWNSNGTLYFEDSKIFPHLPFAWGSGFFWIIEWWTKCLIYWKTYLFTHSFKYAKGRLLSHRPIGLKYGQSL